MNVAVLEYTTASVDIIEDVDDNVKDIEKWLIEHCHYNMDSICWMAGDFDIKHYKPKDFE